MDTSLPDCLTLVILHHMLTSKRDETGFKTAESISSKSVCNWQITKQRPMAFRVCMLMRFLPTAPRWSLGPRSRRRRASLLLAPIKTWKLMQRHATSIQVLVRSLWVLWRVASQVMILVPMPRKLRLSRHWTAYPNFGHSKKCWPRPLVVFKQVGPTCLMWSCRVAMLALLRHSQCKKTIRMRDAACMMVSGRIGSQSAGCIWSVLRFNCCMLLLPAIFNSSSFYILSLPCLTLVLEWFDVVHQSCCVARWNLVSWRWFLSFLGFRVLGQLQQRAMQSYGTWDGPARSHTSRCSSASCCRVQQVARCIALEVCWLSVRQDC